MQQKDHLDITNNRSHSLGNAGEFIDKSQDEYTFLEAGATRHVKTTAVTQIHSFPTGEKIIPWQTGSMLHRSSIYPQVRSPRVLERLCSKCCVFGTSMF